MDTTPTPTGAGQPASVTPILTRDPADIVDLRAAAVVVLATAVLGLVEEVAQLLIVRRGVALAVRVVGRVLEQRHELENAQRLAEDVQGAAPQREALRAHGKGAREPRVEVLHGRAKPRRDVLAGVALPLAQVGLRQRDELAQLVLGAGIPPGVRVRGEIGILKAPQADPQRGRVRGQLRAGRVQGGVKVRGREAALDDAEVVVYGAGDVLVGGDEALGDDETELGVRLGEGHGPRGECRGEGHEEGRPSLREDRGALVHAAAVDAHGALGDDGELGELGLVDLLLAVGDHDRQRGRAGEGGGRAQAATGGDGAVHEDPHGHGLVGSAVFLSEQLEGAPQAGLEVVSPLVDGGVDLDGVEGDVEGVRREAGGLDVGNLDAICAGFDRRAVDLGGHGEEAVGGDGHGEHGVK